MHFRWVKRVFKKILTYLSMCKYVVKCQPKGLSSIRKPWKGGYEKLCESGINGIFTAIFYLYHTNLINRFLA